jgi:hypothetical protein
MAKSSGKDEVEAVLHNMQDQPRDVDVQLKGCIFLTEMAQKGALSQANTAVAMKKVCQAMKDKELLPNACVQGKAICFVTTTMLNNGENIAHAVQEGFISAVLNAMRMHASDMTLQAAGCRALQKFVVDGNR